MQHGVRFENIALEAVISEDGDQDEKECDLRHQVAFGMRWLSNEQEFYTDSSTMRLTDEMKEALKTSKANNYFDGIGRGINT